MQDYYKVLEVDRGASHEIIEKAYKTLAFKFHPDRNPDENEAWAKSNMQLLNEAYQVLKDPIKRHLYDQQTVPMQIWLNDGLIGLFRNWLNSQR